VTEAVVSFFATMEPHKKTMVHCPIAFFPPVTPKQKVTIPFFTTLQQKRRRRRQPCCRCLLSCNKKKEKGDHSYCLLCYNKKEEGGSSLFCAAKKEEGDGNVTIIAFCVALQQHKKKATIACYCLLC
jgi:hypothetical protein